MKRHMYKLTHQNIVPGRIGQVIPVTRMEVAPGDSFQGRIGILCRFKGFAAPVLTPTYLDFYMFYVPNRLAWAEEHGDVTGSWTDFITGTTINAAQETGPVGVPEEEITATTAPPSYVHNDSFLSNRNLQTTQGSENALYSRGYNLIYNNYFKDENDVDIAINNTDWQEAYQLRNLYNECRDDTAQWQTYAEVETDPAGLTGSYVGAESIRDAMRRQRFAERREMFGDRYVDLLRSYGVRTGYNMLERPESLGKSRHVVSFTDIPATAESTTGLTVGDLAGHGIVGLHHRMPRKTFNEHGYIHGVIVVRPSQFINTLSPPDSIKKTVGQYWAPEFESQTAQEVEETLLSSGGLPNEPVGYVPKFQEYRKTNNFIQSKYKGSDSWGSEWTFEQAITSGTGSAIRDDLRKVTGTDYDNAFNSTSATEPHFRALVHNGITAYRLCGPQQKI